MTLARTLMAAALLVIAAGAAAESQPTFTSPAAYQADSGTAASAGHPDAGPAGPAGTDDREGAGYQAMSTLSALALGILGLLWVRRHAAEV